MRSSDIIDYRKFGFDWERYLLLQASEIEKRMKGFSWKLYLEIGWKFLFDAHASRVLPGFYPDSKKRIFEKFKEKAEVIFCINAQDLYINRSLSSENISYAKYCLQMLQDIKSTLWLIAKVSINRVNDTNKIVADGYAIELNNYGYQVYFRYEIDGYPHNTTKILSQDGYGRDEYIHTHKDLVLVTGAASSSGKMSTCLWEMYHDYNKWIDSGYAKYETFPIWNKSLDHPVNLAYEAATADIWDYNQYDELHKKHYLIDAVNYNRDMEAFDIVKTFANSFLPENNFTRHYQSPTDMWISTAGFCITDEQIVRQACIDEIFRRKEWYQEIIDRWNGDEIWVARCKNLLKKLSI